MPRPEMSTELWAQLVDHNQKLLDNYHICFNLDEALKNLRKGETAEVTVHSANEAAKINSILLTFYPMGISYSSVTVKEGIKITFRVR